MRTLRALFTFSSLYLLTLGSNAQLTYQLSSTLLNIDVVVDSDRVDIPWEILWGPDDRLWMTDGPLITRWDPLTDVIDTLLQRSYGNGLGMALHPDFPFTPIVMAVFDTSSYYAGGDLCEVSRFTYDPVNDRLIDEEVLFTYPHSGEHGGGRLLFDTAGYVLLTTADYWHPDDSLFYNRGKTLRFGTDGTVPSDNPRADYTWSWGHRNPQGLAMLPNGGIVNTEHGQATNEINLILPNRDHGWFAYDGAQCTNIFPDSCTSATFVNTLPLAEFIEPPAGAEFYSSPAIPELQNKLLAGILWFTGIKLFTFNESFDSITEQDYLNGGAFTDMVRLRDIAIRPDGAFYLITNDRQNARIRLVHNPLATLVAPINPIENTLVAWPNPTVDDLNVITGASGSLEVFDMRGSRLSIPSQRMGDRIILDLSGCANGLYIRRSTGPGPVRSTRIIKQ